MTAPTQETTTLDEALAHIAAEPVVWVRMAAIRQPDDSWHSHLLELTSGEPPPSWDVQTWEYPHALFVGTTLGGTAVADALRAHQLSVEGREVTMPQVQDSVRWERRQSRSSAMYEALEWPASESALSMPASVTREPQGHLLPTERAPSFLNFYTAAAAFFWLSRQPIGGSVNQGTVYRHQDTRGRINRVSISDDSVEIQVEGAGIDGLIVELAGDSPGPVNRIWTRAGAKTDTLQFSLNEGLPGGAWVVLRNGSEWIDRRFLAVPWTHGVEAGVEVLVEPLTRLEAFLANREGPQIEFKRQLPQADDEKLKTLKTVCAFANGPGGSVLFGIDDDHNVQGLTEANIDRLKDRLTQLVETWIEPRVQVEFAILPIRDTAAAVLEMRVPPGIGLYGCARPGEVPVPYIRHHARSVRARPAEIETIVRDRSAGNPTFPSHFLG